MFDTVSRLATKLRKLAMDCKQCRQGFCCGRCLCCMSEEKLHEIVQAAKEEEMPIKNAGRSTTGEAAVSYYPCSSAQETAKHLRLTTSRFLSERATVGDVDEAIRMWHEATKKAK